MRSNRTKNQKTKAILLPFIRSHANTEGERPRIKTKGRFTRYASLAKSRSKQQTKKKKNDVMGIYRKRRTETRESKNNRSHSKEVNTKRGYRDDDRCQQAKKSKEPCVCMAREIREEVKMEMLVFADFSRRNTEKSLSFGVEGGG